MHDMKPRQNADSHETAIRLSLPKKTLNSLRLQHPLFTRIQKFIASERLLQNIEHIDMALSGGADSVCLLAMLCLMRQTNAYTFTLRAHHIRHHLRDDDGTDAQVAQSVAKQLGVEYIETQLTWENTGKPTQNIENAARDARYHALFSALNALKSLQHPSSTPSGVYALALAHHGDENVETMLWRLGRGCGIEGLCMAPKRIQNDIALIRPLLCISKEEIYQFLRDHELPWAEDPTNATPKYQRNRIRHQILPILHQESMSTDCLYRSLLQVRCDADALTSLATHFVQAQRYWQNAWFCPWNAWEMLDKNAQAQVLRHAARLIIPGLCPEASFITRVLEMLSKRTQTHRQTRHAQIVAAWSHGGIMLYPADERPVPQHIAVNIPCESLDIWKLCRLSVWRQTLETIPANTKMMLHLDASIIQGQLTIRPASEFLHLQTAIGNLCKTREALRSQGVPDCWRHAWPVLCDDTRPLWVLGGMRTLLAKPPVPHQLAITIMIEWG